MDDDVVAQLAGVAEGAVAIRADEVRPVLMNHFVLLQQSCTGKLLKVPRIHRYLHPAEIEVGEENKERNNENKQFPLLSPPQKN